MSTKFLHKSRQLTALLLVWLLLIGTAHAGIAITGADGTPYTADSLLLHQPNGIAITGADATRIVNADGIATTGVDGISATTGDGIAITGADGIAITGADGATAITADGRTLSISPNGISITGADNIAVTRANGIVVTGAKLISETGITNLAGTNGASAAQQSGLQSVDLELALTLNRLTDDSTVNCVVLYHQ